MLRRCAWALPDVPAGAHVSLTQAVRENAERARSEDQRVVMRPHREAEGAAREQGEDRREVPSRRA